MRGKEEKRDGVGKEREVREREYKMAAVAATHFLVIVPAWWAPSM